jgi:hypothetical protein
LPPLGCGSFFDINLHSRKPLLVPTPARLIEACKRVTNNIPLGCPLFLPVHTVNCVQTLKAAVGNATSVTTGSGASDIVAPGCTLTYNGTVGTYASAFFNTKSNSTVCCGAGKVHGFRQKFTLEDATGSNACSLD